MITKFDLNQLKRVHRRPYSFKCINYQHAEKPGEIRRVLYDDAADYVRKTKRIPEDKLCITYYTKQGKVAVLALDTPKKRFLFRKAEQEQFTYGTSNQMNALKEKYGFIPQPINVLKKYVDYGYMKSQDVEHLYHNEQVDWKISDDISEFEDAYSILFEERDVVVDGFNGYSCMSEEPNVGTFYWFFGAKMLLFYKKGTEEIVGRMVIWPWEDKLHIRKGYLRTAYQFAAAAVVEELVSKGTLTREPLPSTFHADLKCVDGKSQEEVYEEIKHKCRVPYIDEDLCLSGDKMHLNFYGDLECKDTDAETLENYGHHCCEECGEEIDDPDDEIWIGDYCYCPNCAKCCHRCDEWFAPDEDGEYTKSEGWVCESCLEGNYHYCDWCEEYVNNEDTVTIIDKGGYEQEICEDCAEGYCKRCEECGSLFEIDDNNESDKCYNCRCCENVKND